jgi:glutaredoxin-like protein
MLWVGVSPDKTHPRPGGVKEYWLIMERLLSDAVVEQVRQAFDQLKEPVQILFFGAKSNCDYCDDTRQLVEEVVELTDSLRLSIYDLEDDVAIARQYKVDKAPGMVILGREGEQLLDYGVRVSGIPAGHEFSSFIHDIILVSSRDSGLNEKTRQFLGDLSQPVHLQVFVTPTCPYCPRAVVLAHQMAMESPWVEAEMVEATEFPELAERYNVSGVPQTTINFGAGTLIGAAPEDYLIDEIRRALETA